MNCPICSWTAESTEYPFIYETDHWTVKLAPNQSLLGRCVVSTKRHVESLAGLTQDEMSDLLGVIRLLEGALKRSFPVALFNWSCYMNHAYRESTPTPHVHWWLVPRYSHAFQKYGSTFDDPHFGSPYDHDRWHELPAETRVQIVEEIRAACQGT